MLLQLENSQQDDVNKLLAFAKQNHLNLSLVDDSDEYYLPGKPLDENVIFELIESSRKSGTISTQEAHCLIRKNYNAD
jgi:hypothetical protein